jgi:hypothetical protein
MTVTLRILSTTRTHRFVPPPTRRHTDTTIHRVVITRPRVGGVAAARTALNAVVRVAAIADIEVMPSRVHVCGEYPFVLVRLFYPIIVCVRISFYFLGEARASL